MAKSAVIDTKASEDFGAVARRDNTIRVFVGPNELGQDAVTATWALSVSSNVPRLATIDAATTNNIRIPLHVPMNDAEVQSGSGTSDRGYRVLGLELIYEVAASALGGFDLDIWRLTPAADGTTTAAEVTTTLVPDTVGDTGVEIDKHRMQATIAARDRFFLDSGSIVFGRADITDGTSSDVDIIGAIWHLEKVTV